MTVYSEETMVHAIAMCWGGTKSVPTKRDDGRWIFYEIQEDYNDAKGFCYLVSPPGITWDAIEDSGRPCGEVDNEDKYIVRCVNDAPDAVWYVTQDGTYHGWNAPFNVITKASDMALAHMRGDHS